MEKRVFIKKFIEIVGEILEGPNDLMRRESMSRKIIRMGGIDPDEVYGGFRNLQHRKIITGEGDRYRFTAKGKEWLIHSRRKYFKSIIGRWDRRWRIVIFDIPQEFHRQRNTFRNRLKSLGFFMLQKSVFVIPYPCEEELGYICQDLGINGYVDIITAKTIGFREEELKEHFDI